MLEFIFWIAIYALVVSQVGHYKNSNNSPWHYFRRLLKVTFLYIIGSIGAIGAWVLVLNAYKIPIINFVITDYWILVSFGVTGLGLFILKSECNRIYGALEVIFALSCVYYVIIPNDTEMAKVMGNFTTLYVLVRGIENINKTENDKKSPYKQIKNKICRYLP